MSQVWAFCAPPCSSTSSGSPVPQRSALTRWFGPTSTLRRSTVGGTNGRPTSSAFLVEEAELVVPDLCHGVTVGCRDDPRIQPVSLNDADPETRELLGALSTLRGDDAEVLNVFKTMAQHPKLMKRWLVFANHVLTKSTLSGRDRELAILRAGWRCDAPYEWGQHVATGRREGITDDEVAQIAAGPNAPGWSAHDAAILRGRRAARPLDDLRRNLGHAHRDLRRVECMDLVLTIGQYHLVSFALNAFGVERDDGIDDPAIPFPPSRHHVTDTTAPRRPVGC